MNIVSSSSPALSVLFGTIDTEKLIMPIMGLAFVQDMYEYAS